MDATGHRKAHDAGVIDDDHDNGQGPEKVETWLAFAIFKTRINSERSRGLSHRSDTNQKVEVVNQIENKRSTSHAHCSSIAEKIFQTF